MHVGTDRNDTPQRPADLRRRGQRAACTPVCGTRMQRTIYQRITYGGIGRYPEVGTRSQRTARTTASAMETTVITSHVHCFFGGPVGMLRS